VGRVILDDIFALRAEVRGQTRTELAEDVAVRITGDKSPGRRGEQGLVERIRCRKKAYRAARARERRIAARRRRQEEGAVVGPGELAILAHELVGDLLGGLERQRDAARANLGIAELLAVIEVLDEGAARRIGAGETQEHLVFDQRRVDRSLDDQLL